jgi:hypothetical protein
MARLFYCSACGAMVHLDPRQVDPCEWCGSVLLRKITGPPWPIRLSAYDKKFLSEIRVAATSQ